MLIFKNSKAYIRGRGIVRADIAVENGTVTKIGKGLCGGQEVDTGDCLLVAGFIDEHIHGAAGADAMDCSARALETISRALLKEGTTSFLATTMTQSADKLAAAVGAAAGFKGDGARLLGVHLEGPFISRKHLGAQSSEHVVSPSVEFFRRLQSVSDNVIRMVTLAPEEGGAAELIKYLKDSGVIVSAGHSNATAEDMRVAAERGVTCVTHTFNAMSPCHHREIGLAGSALLCDGLFSEVIADTVHIGVPALKLLIKNKPADKLVLVTDSIRAKGIEGRVSELGGQTVYVENGQARLKDGTLAGSVLKMNEAVKNLVRKCGTTVEYAVDCATYNPASNLGLQDRYGIIKVGAAADFALLDEEFNVKATVVGGILKQALH